jgi:hypothetical protein
MNSKTGQTTDMTQKYRTHVFKFLKPSEEKTVNLHGIKLHLKTKIHR